MIARLIDQLVRLRMSLALKIIISIIVLMAVLMIGLFVVNTNKYEEMAIRNAAIKTDEIAEVVKAGLKNAMRLEPRKDTAALLDEVQDLRHIDSVAVYDKLGHLSFAGVPELPKGPLPKDHPLCVMCHAQEPPLAEAALADRYAVVGDGNGGRMLRIVSPIPNDPGCSTADCHSSQSGDTFLGIVEMTVSLDSIEANLSRLVMDNATYVLFSLVVIVLTLFAVTYLLVDRPIRTMIEATRNIATGDYGVRVDLKVNDELGELGRSINRMARDVGRHHEELSKQRRMYQSLFEGVPCLITVQDKDYRLVRYNQTFAERFQAKPGDHCYRAYKGRDCKCEICPVEKTFADGKSHTTEEIGYYKDGTEAHWIVNTAPIFDEKGEIVAAMEMCLDITQRKRLEKDLKASEQKYCAIFNNIPNAVLAIDAETLDVIDCNQTALSLYGHKKGLLIRRPVTNLVAEAERDTHLETLAQAGSLKRTRHITAEGGEFWASVNVTRSHYEGRDVLLAVVTDISERIQSEEQLIQASKMATLGEMATGVAHELNQPLAVLQMVASLFKRKLAAGKPIDADTAGNMSAKISNNVGRATKIISHMREFGRKSNIDTEEVLLNDVIGRSFDFFSQQLTLHDIAVEWDLDDELPPIQADPNRLEQVFINMLLNARDAIDERDEGGQRTITLRTRHTRRHVIAEVRDTGTGIPKDILPRLFEPFFTTKEVGKGTGLGLSISYGIVRDYGGSIHATSPADGGSRFVISLPRA